MKPLKPDTVRNYFQDNVKIVAVQTIKLDPEIWGTAQDYSAWGRSRRGPAFGEYFELCKNKRYWVPAEQGNKLCLAGLARKARFPLIEWLPSGSL